MQSRILLEEVKIYAYHGVLPEERIIGTYFIINLEVQSDLSKAAETDDLQDTISYATINDILHEEMAIPSALLEHVAGRILKKISTVFPQIKALKIKIAKTNPPMKGEIKSAAVELFQSF